MSDTSKQISGLKKQNDGMFNSLSAKGIKFERQKIQSDDTEEIQLQKLSLENTQLKDLVKANKPPPQPKEEKLKPAPQLKKEEKKNKDCDEEYEEDEHEEKKHPLETIANMEGMKSNFFTGDYDSFKQQVKQHPIKFMRASYKYNSDKDGVQDYNAKNLIKGFLQNFGEMRVKKAFMICFRCFQVQKDPTKYEYNSLWVVNTPVAFSEIKEISDIVNDFEFTTIEESGVDQFLNELQKLPKDSEDCFSNNCIAEAYVH